VLGLTLHTYSSIIIIIIIIIIINCKCVYPRWQCATMKDRTIQQHISQKITLNPQYAKLQKIKNTYRVKTQKRIEPKVDKSVFKTTRYTKQCVNHTILYSITHISPRPTPHSTSLHLYTLHIPLRLKALPFTAFS
jgi:hypothetical protein